MTARLASQLRSSLWTILVPGLWNIGIFSLVLNAFLLVPSIFLIQVYDRVLPSHSLTTLIYLSLIVFGALAFLGLMDVVRSIYAQRIATVMDRELGADAFMMSLSGSRAWTADTRGLRDLASVRNFIASRGMASLFDLPFAPLFIVLLYFVHPMLSLLTLAGILVMALLMLLNQIAVRNKLKVAQEKSAQANLTAQAFMRSSDTLRAMGMTNNALEAWGQQFSQSAVLQDSAGGLNSMFSGLSRSIRMMLQAGILGTGAYYILQGEMTAGMIFASSIISGRALQPIDQLIGNWKPASEAWCAWSRLSSALRVDTPTDFGERLRLPSVRGHIVARNLSWSVSNRNGESAAILKRINFEVAPGESVAIIGPSGAGKTTLAKILAGALTPTDGTILIDGAEYATWDPEQIGAATGYLAQDVQLLPATIAENISRLDPDREDAMIIEAARKAQAHDLILGLPDGYQTYASQDGAGLSGGMRQRVGLARAFYGQPRILVLDEPNSNLDAEGEAALELALSQAKAAHITVFVITHRPTTAQRRDKVMLIRNGVVEAFGPARSTLAAISGAPDGGPAPRQQQKTAYSDKASNRVPSKSAYLIAEPQEAE